MTKTKLAFTIVVCAAALLGGCTPKPKEMPKTNNEAAIEDQVAPTNVTVSPDFVSVAQNPTPAETVQNPQAGVEITVSKPANNDKYTSSSAMPQNPLSTNNKGRATTAGVNQEALRLRASGVEVGVKIHDDASVPTQETPTPE